MSGNAGRRCGLPTPIGSYIVQDSKYSLSIEIRPAQSAMGVRCLLRHRLPRRQLLANAAIAASRVACSRKLRRVSGGCGRWPTWSWLVGD
jgi:hypothetical protein